MVVDTQYLNDKLLILTFFLLQFLFLFLSAYSLQWVLGEADWTWFPPRVLLSIICHVGHFNWAIQFLKESVPSVNLTAKIPGPRDLGVVGVVAEPSIPEFRLDLPSVIVCLTLSFIVPCATKTDDLISKLEGTLLLWIGARGSPADACFICD